MCQGSIHADTFQGLSGLRALYLQDNLLSDVGGGLFRNLQLEALDLRRNGIETLHPETFRGLQFVRSKYNALYLEGNMLSLSAVQVFPGL